MPRPIVIRPSYDSDAASLIRLMEALDKDTTRHTAEWLHAGQEKLKVAAQHLLTAREDAAKKLGLDRDEAKKAEQGRNKRAK